MSLGLGVIGCGSVFAGPYRGMIEKLRAAGRAHVSAVYDVDDAKRRGAAGHYDADPDLRGAEDVVGADNVDIVLVLTSMNEHGPLAKAALEAGRHVLVEKPMATSLDEAAELSTSPGRRKACLACAPHTLLSPTFRAVHGAVRDGRVGDLLTGRARYGWQAHGGTSGSTRGVAGRCSTSGSTTSPASAPSSARRGESPRWWAWRFRSAR